MTLGFLLAIQVGILAVVIIVFLLVYVLRLKKSLKGLQAILANIKDDLGGVSIISHLQDASKQTLIACQKDTAAYSPDHDAADQAISLRCMALSAEIAVIEGLQKGKVSFDAAMAPYRAVAQQITDYLHQTRENIKGQTAADFQHKVTELQRNLEAINRKHKALEDTQKRLKILVDLLENTEQRERTKDQVEQVLHTALASVCESFSEALAVREIVYLYHEAYFDRRNGNAGGTSTAFNMDDGMANNAPLAAHATSFDAGQHIDMLNNIIDEQKQLVRELQTRILQLDPSHEREEIDEKAEALDQQVQEAKTCLDMLEIELTKYKDQSLTDYNSEEVMDIIEQFTEESAQMMERLHMLNNQNKMLTTENEDLRMQIDLSTESEQPMVVGLKHKVQQQTEEVIALQASYKKLEEQYLALYESTHTHSSVS